MVDQSAETDVEENLSLMKQAMRIAIFGARRRNQKVGQATFRSWNT